MPAPFAGCDLRRVTLGFDAAARCDHCGAVFAREIGCCPGCSRAITSTLRNRGYDVTLAEFDGGHELPATVVNQSLDWALR